ncbi:MAG: glycosyltransferase [Bacteroidota bacterium]
MLQKVLIPMFVSFIVVFFVFYIFFLVQIKTSNTKINLLANTGFAPKNNISVIVPIKNEAKNISSLFKSFAEQNFPSNLVQIFIVDDCSTDNSLEEIEKTKALYPLLKITLIKNHGQGKKQAINTAMLIAQTKYVVLTDADSIHSKNWLLAIAAFCETFQPKLLVGAVFMKSSNFFQDFQACDYAAMQIIGANLLQKAQPVLCSGANLTVERESFLGANPYQSNIDIASGDDMFIMQSFIHKYGKEAIKFLNTSNSFSFTKAKENLNEYVEQRIRWASKTKYYLKSSTTLLGLLVFGIHLSLLLLLIFSFFNYKIVLVFCIVYLIKTILEYLIFKDAEKKYELKFPLKWFAVFQVLQIIFIPILALISVFKKNTNWKA